MVKCNKTHSKRDRTDLRQNQILLNYISIFAQHDPGKIVLSGSIEVNFYFCFYKISSCLVEISNFDLNYSLKNLFFIFTICTDGSRL